MRERERERERERVITFFMWENMYRMEERDEKVKVKLWLEVVERNEK